MGLTHGDVRRILEILTQARDLDYVEITLGDHVLRAGRGPAPAAPLAAPASAPPSAQPGLAESPDKVPAAPSAAPSAAPAEVPPGMTAVRAPMAGTFYLTPSPEEPPFVSEGAKVAPGDTLCLVEVMKMFNSVPAACAGHVHRIVAAHGTSVAMDEVLMILEPEASA